MPQQIVYTDEKEDTIVVKHSKFWKISKAETIKKIIKEYGKISKITVILLLIPVLVVAFSQEAIAADKLIIPSGSDPVSIINANFLVDQNISSSDSILMDYLFPKANAVIRIENLSVNQDIFTAGNISTSDSLLADYIFPNLVSFTLAGNLAIAKNIHILEEISSNKFHFYKKELSKMNKGELVKKLEDVKLEGFNYYKITFPTTTASGTKTVIKGVQI